MGVRKGERGGRVGQVQDFRAQPRLPRQLNRVPEGLYLPVALGVAGRIGVGEMRPDPHDPNMPACLCARSRLKQRRPVGAGGATAPHSGVDLQMQQTRAVCSLGRPGCRLDRPRGAG